jgi:hypothetical protein
MQAGVVVAARLVQPERILEPALQGLGRHSESIYVRRSSGQWADRLPVTRSDAWPQ